MSDESGVIGSKKLIRKFVELGEAVQGEVNAVAVTAGATVVVKAAKENIKKRGLIRTRTLSRSIHSEVSEKSHERAVVEAGTNQTGAALHEFGGTVRARKGKYLAIPVGNYKDSPTKHPKLKLRKTIGGTLILVSPDGTVQYVLKESVVIPSEPYMRPAGDENKEEVSKAMGRAWKSAILKKVEEG